MSDKSTLMWEQCDEPYPENPNAKPVSSKLRVVAVKYDAGFPQPVFGIVELEDEPTCAIHHADELANRLTATEARLAEAEKERANLDADVKAADELLARHGISGYETTAYGIALLLDRLADATKRADEAVRLLSVVRVRCDNLIHGPGDDHNPTIQPCPALARFRARLAQIGGKDA